MHLIDPFGSYRITSSAYQKWSTKDIPFFLSNLGIDPLGINPILPIQSLRIN